MCATIAETLLVSDTWLLQRNIPDSVLCLKACLFSKTDHNSVRVFCRNVFPNYSGGLHLVSLKCQCNSMVVPFPYNS